MKQVALRHIGVAGVLVGLLAGCSTTPDAAQVPVSLPPVSSEASFTESAVTSTLVATSSVETETSVAAVETSESVAPSVQPPWQADFTPEQQAMAQEAIAVLIEAWRIGDQVTADPAREWETAIRTVMGDPIASQYIAGAASLAADGYHSAGTTAVEVLSLTLEGSGEAGTTAQLQLCVDSANKTLLDASDKSVGAPMEIGPRIVENATVYLFPEPNGWLLSEIYVPTPDESC